MTDISQPEEAAVSIEHGATGSQVRIEDKIQTAGLSFEYDTDDAISLSDDHDDHTIGLIDPGNFDMDGVYTRSRGLLLMSMWRAPNRKQFATVFMPEGADTGMEEHAFNTFMTGFEVTCDDSSTATLNSKHKVSGEVVTGTV